MHKPKKNANVRHSFSFLVFNVTLVNLYIFNIKVLDRVIKKNPKYENVESTIDTGASVTKYLKKVEEIKTSNLIQICT